MAPKKIAVLGAGIVGCTTAYALTQAGFEVTLIDAQAEPAALTSRANGAQLSYSYVEPLASSATLRGLPAMLLTPNSPLKLRPALDTAQWIWGWNFLRACTRARANSTTRSLLELGALSRQALDGWLAKEGWPCDHAEAGKLVLYGTERALQSGRTQVALQATWGTQQSVLSQQECVAREPALESYTQQFAGAVYTASECVADPYQLCSALVNSISQQGAYFMPKCAVLEMRATAAGVTLNTTQGEQHFDSLVLCSGNQTALFERELGLRGAVYPIKGYSVTLALKNAALAPRVSVTDLKRKTVFARLGDRLRVAGRAEIVGHDTRIETKRIAELIAATEALFPGACLQTDPQPWVGLRPATATGLPIISATRLPGVFVNLGHGALGLTLAAGAAQLVTALVQGSDALIKTQQFAIK